MATPAEELIRAKASSGEVIELDGLRDDERVVGPGFFREVLLDHETYSIPSQGIYIRKPRFVDPLALMYVNVSHPVWLENAEFATPPNFSFSAFRSLGLMSCTLPRFDSRRIRVDEDLVFRNCTVEGAISCVEATIGGIILLDGCHAGDEINLAATTARAISADKAELRSSTGDALCLMYAHIAEDLDLTEIQSEGRVTLIRATIGGDVVCTGARFSSRSGEAFDASRAQIGGSLVMIDSAAQGTVTLLSTSIGGDVRCDGAEFSGGPHLAFVADRAQIGGRVQLTDFKAAGRVQIISASLGNLYCRKATVAIDDEAAVDRGTAIEVTSTDIADLASFDHVDANGVVELSSSRAKWAIFKESRFQTFLPYALRLDYGRFSNVHMSNMVMDTGVSLQGTDVAGDLEMSEVRVATDQEPTVLSLDAKGLRVGRKFKLFGNALHGHVNLHGARVETLEDHIGDSAGSGWQGGKCHLGDFYYERFAASEPEEVDHRLRWLTGTVGFQPRAWEQLVDAYRRAGRDADARRAAIAKEDDRRRRAKLSRPRRIGRLALGILIGHGYRPARAGLWAAIVIGAFAFLIWGFPHHFVPTGGVRGTPQPLIYAADTFVPVIDFREAEHWTATGWMQWVQWTIILCGWALTTLFIAGFTRIVRT